MPTQNQPIFSLVMMIAMLAIFWFLLIRPQKKQEQKLNEMRTNLKVGDKIITVGGIVGEVVIIKEDFVTIETTGMKNRIELVKTSIGQVVEK